MKTPEEPTMAFRLTARPVRNLWPAFLLLAVAIWRAPGQTPGTLDLSFDPGTAIGTNYSGVVHTLLPLPDGSVVVGGEFIMPQGAARDNIVRLLPNAATDSTFVARVTRMGGFTSVEALAQQGNKILVGGNFDSVNGLTRRGLARLNSDGTLDTTFNPSLGSSPQFNSIILQPDGRIVLAGFFTLTVSNTYRSDMVRLDANGAVDLSFDVGSYGVGGGFPYAVALQSDGKFLVGGFFSSSVDNYPTNLAPLNPNGALDTNYWPGFDTFGIIYGIAVQTDGKAILAGDFDNVGGITRYGYARMNTDGTVDLSFELRDAGTNLFSSGGRLACAAVQPDQKVLLGGMYTATGGLWGDRVVRFLPDGTADQSFVAPGSLSSGSIETMALQADGKILVGGRFQDYGGLARRGVARLHGDAISQPTLLSISQQSPGTMRLEVTNPPMQTVIVQAATNLNAGRWLPLATNAPGTNRFQFVDTNAWRFPRRFYRAYQINP